MRFGLVLLTLALTLPVSAQLPSPAELAQLRNNPELVRQRIRQSGLTAGQIRARLVAAGYPANMLDAYLGDAALDSAEVQEDHIGALGILGVADRRPEGVQTLEQQSGVERGPRGGADAELNLFGADVFRGRTTQFQPLLAGPVPENYRIGPGDVLVLVLTGDVEFVHTLEVTRDGFVLIPQVGQLYLNNLTMDALRTTLRRRLGESYSGVRTGTTQFDVTIARLRTNQVFVIGEVVQPGAYQLASVATVLNGLYAAGGPTDRGNFREVVVRRQGDTVSVFDLYDYLLAGDTRNDIVLNQGDVIFVPVQGTRAAVRGAIVRPAIYELAEGETLRELIATAGGFRPSAALRRISISRIVPPAQRGPGGPDRITVDVPIEQVVDGTAPPFPIEPGDQVLVFDVPAARRAMVELLGAVYHPGEYGWRPGLRLSEVVRLAGGFRPALFTERGLIERLNPTDSTRYMIPIALPADSLAPWPHDPELFDYDVVRVYSRESFREDRTVGIRGMVTSPGVYAYRAGMTLRDLVLLARGTRDGARLDSAEVATLPENRRGGILAVVRRVPIDSSYLFEGDTSTYPLLPGIAGAPRGSAADVPLLPFDEVLILQQPDFELQRTVTIRGEVANPGTYALQRKDERLSELVARAGGLMRNAYPEGGRLVRPFEGAGRVNIRLDRALERPGRGDDVILQPGDEITVPEFIATVRVEGAVVSPTSVLYREGEGFDYYLRNAGGFAENADEGRVSVRQANGEARTPGRFLFWRSFPTPGPGATVFVPTAAPSEGFDVTGFFGSLAQILASTVAIIVVVRR